MARIRVPKVNYTSGELSTEMFGRVENRHYINGAKKLRNVIVVPQGGWRTRPGSAMRARVPDTTTGPSKTRLIAYQKSIEERYLLMLYDRGFNVYRRGEFQVSVNNQPWTEDTLKDIAWGASLDTVLIFHGSWQPQAIQRQGSDTAFSTFQWPMKNLPRFEFPGEVYTNGVDEVQELRFDGGQWSSFDRFTLTLGGEETEAIEYSTIPATLATRIQDALRALKITSDDGITVTHSSGDYEVTMGGDDGNQPWGEMVGLVKYADFGSNRTILESVTTKGEYPGEDVWSDKRGWPRCGAFIDGRLWAGGSPSRPSQALASRAGDEQDFLDDQDEDDFGINITLGGAEVPAILQIFQGRHIQFFTSSAEFYIPTSASQAVTPKNAAVRSTTFRGSKAGLPVFDIEGGTMFVQGSPEGLNDNRGVALREFIFSDAESAYLANDVSLLAPHLVQDPVAVGVRRATSVTDCDYWLSVNGEASPLEDDEDVEGLLTVLCTLRGQEVNAFAAWETDGLYKDVAVDGTQIFTVVERTDRNGDPVRFLEEHVEGLFMDCCIYDNAVQSPLSVITGLDHLEGLTVGVYVDGSWQREKVVVNGQITLDADAEKSYQVGLRWPVVNDKYGYRFVAEDLGIQVDLQDGTTVGRKRRVVEATLNLKDTVTVSVNGNRIVRRKFGSDLLDQPVEPMNGDQRKRGLRSGWDLEGTVAVGDQNVGKVTVRSSTKAVAV